MVVANSANAVPNFPAERILVSRPDHHALPVGYWTCAWRLYRRKQSVASTHTNADTHGTFPLVLLVIVASLRGLHTVVARVGAVCRGILESKVGSIGDTNTDRDPSHA